MAFDERNKKIARTITNLLNELGIEYAALGMEETCCGETARRMGHEYIFQVMAEENIQIFNEFQFERIVTPCPHCYNTFKNEYPKFGGEFEVQHLSELLCRACYRPGDLRQERAQSHLPRSLLSWPPERCL